MSDLIDREEAIRIASGYCHPANIVKELEKLPSASPDLSGYSDRLWKLAYERGKAEGQAEIIRCKDCRHEDGVGYCKILFMDVMPMWFCCLGMRRSDSDG